MTVTITEDNDEYVKRMTLLVVTALDKAERNMAFDAREREVRAHLPYAQEITPLAAAVHDFHKGHEACLRGLLAVSACQQEEIIKLRKEVEKQGQVIREYKSLNTKLR